VDLALRVNEDTTKEQNQSSGGEDKSCYELEVGFHFREFFCKYIPEKGRFANFLTKKQLIYYQA